MKYIVIVLLAFITIGLTTTHAATTPTPLTTVTPTGKVSGTPSPTVKPSTVQENTALDKQINDLKERIASRVAQLKLVEKRGILGSVTDVTQTQITINDIHGDIRYVDVDELTKFSSPSAKTGFGISDLSKGNTVGILGLWNKDSRRLLARFVDVQNLQQIFSGAITKLDTDNASFTLTTPDNKDVVIDVETITKTNAFTQGALTKSGFSKMQQGERVVVVAIPDTKNSKHFIALRVIRLPGVAINPKIVLFKPGELNVTPSTGSGTKLVPIIKK